MVEMCFLSRTLRVPWTAKGTNMEVLQQARTKREVMGTIRKRQLGFLGHTLRGEGIEKDCLLGMVGGARVRGRQRRNFMDCIKEWTGCRTKKEVKRPAENRAMCVLL